MYFKKGVGGTFGCIQDVILEFREEEAGNFWAVGNLKLFLNLTVSIKNRDDTMFGDFGEVKSSNE